jgi:hypothetical protein
MGKTGEMLISTNFGVIDVQACFSFKVEMLSFRLVLVECCMAGYDAIALLWSRGEREKDEAFTS